jgi:class 3 adenylate cyclase
MEAVVDAVGVDRIDVAGELTPCHFAVGYALLHPERVRNLLLWNPGPKGTSPRSRMPDWQRELAAKDWWSFVNLLALQVFGWRRADVAERFAERLRLHVTADQYDHMMDAIESVDAADAAGVQARTLVISDENFLGISDEDSRVKRQAFARRLAARIPAAQLSIIKGGDLTGAGDVAVQFLEPGFQPRHPGGGGAAAAIILFADVVDSTATAGQLGNVEFRERTRQLEDSLRRVIEDAGGVPVEGRTLGDGVLGVFLSAAQAIDAAVRGSEQGGKVALKLHLGIHAGDVIHEDRNVSGMAVSIAARISDLSAPNEILVSSTVRDLALASTDVVFEDRGEAMLKGVGEPVRVFAVLPKS